MYGNAARAPTTVSGGRARRTGSASRRHATSDTIHSRATLTIMEPAIPTHVVARSVVLLTAA